MFANFLIGLREGLEAVLVVSILIAYLVKSDRRELIRFVWIGVAAAVSLSLAVGAALTFGSASMTDEVEEAFAGLMSILAVALVTWMIFWMARRARFLKGELQAQLDRAADAGAWALVLMAFVAVAREGLETALFIWSAVQANGGGPAPLSGAALGLATSVGLGWLIYRGALRLNLRTFFTWTGAALVVVAAGVLSYGVHDLQEAGLLPGANVMAFDVSGAVPESSWYGTLLKGVFNFSAETTWLQLVVWVAYLILTMTLFLWTVQGGKPPTAAPKNTMATAGNTP